MLIARRNAMMAGKRLPYDAEVEYLSSSENASAGTSAIPPIYIDTGVALSSGIKMSVTAAFNSTAQQLVGCYGGSSGRFDIGINDSSVFLTSIGATSTRSTADTNIHEFVLDAPNAMAYIDGVGVATGRFIVDIPGNVFLFTRGRGDRTPPLDYTVAASKASIKIYSCKIWQNGVLIRDFIPVRVGNVGYIYDRVSGQLFGNAGSGAFILGPDIVPVEYIESHGTEWVNTGVDARYDTRVITRVKVVQIASGGSSHIFGARNVNSGGAGFGIAIINGLSSDYFGNRTQILSSTPSSWVSIDKNGRVCTADEVTKTQPESVSTTNTSIALFGLNANGAYTSFGGRVEIAKTVIYNSGVLVRDFIPVRVGTDATSWEGAMMDVLTRRIYRNQGTGAFAYGNDLKYPIPAE